MYKYSSSVKQVLTYTFSSCNVLQDLKLVNLFYRNQRNYIKCHRPNLQYYYKTCLPYFKCKCDLLTPSNCLEKYIYRKKFSTSIKTILNDKHFSDKDLKSIALKYPNPKNVLNNYYAIVSNELKIAHHLSIQYKVSPHRKGDASREWSCTYSVRWPQEMRTSGAGPSKAEASRRAALHMLLQLQQAGRILDNGQPVLYDKATFERITKRSFLPLQLDASVQLQLERLLQLYEQQRDKLQPSEPEPAPRAAETASTTHNDWGLSAQIFQSPETYTSRSEAGELPIGAHKDELFALLDRQRVLVVRGEPGCGKSTRVPQYVLEHWVSRHGRRPVRLLVTQPRRIAAISLAERVAAERSEPLGHVVGYQVRFRSCWDARNTRLLYCTTGVLLRQLQQDPALRRCTHVLLDEAHERDVNTELLLNLLRRALQLNPQLHLLVMSATVDAGLFSRYLGDAPVLQVPGLAFPVRQHFLEDIPLALRQTREARAAAPLVVPEDVAELVHWIDSTQPAGAVLCFLPGWDEISKVRRRLLAVLRPSATMVLALHSKLSDEDQKKIFSRPPSGVRKIILATNIAETSVTVDDVVYVVDSGAHREPRFDPERGVDCMETRWVSQASVAQRKGRAGRVQPGVSYHLYPRSVHHSMDRYSLPEILRVSLTKIVLDALVYSGGEEPGQFFGRLLSPPERASVEHAVTELRALRLLDEDGQVTALGRVIAEFQMQPCLAKAMVLSVLYRCVTPLVDIATLFGGERELFSTALQDKAAVRNIKARFSPTSDHLALVLLLEKCFASFQHNYKAAMQFCQQNNIIPHRINTLQKLQQINFEYLEKHLNGVVDLSDEMSVCEEVVKGVLVAGVGRVLQRRAWDVVKGRLKATPTYFTADGHRATIATDSVNTHQNTYNTPFYVYINQIRSVIRRTNLIRETSIINPLTLLLFYNEELTIKRSPESEDINSEKLVLLQFNSTKIKFVCSERQAELIKKISKMLRYLESLLIEELTGRGSVESDARRRLWLEVLRTLSGVLRAERPASPPPGPVSAH